MYGTCPDSCPLKPAGKSGTTEIDPAYLQEVKKAVPKGGCSWTYTHFGPDVIGRPNPGETVINLSADTDQQAVELAKAGYPTVVTVTEDRDARVDTVDGVRLVRCPAEYNDKVTCNNCGSGRPLCARGDRDYVVKFTAHGQAKKKVGTTESGGCYGSGGPVAIHWKKAAELTQTVSDVETLHRWVRTLPYGTKIRHHVVGDLGRST